MAGIHEQGYRIPSGLELVGLGDPLGGARQRAKAKDQGHPQRGSKMPEEGQESDHGEVSGGVDGGSALRR